jgi:5-oxoprolinase (ATP-hydrolysing)
MYQIGIDVGGTFTDLVAIGEDRRPRYFKVPSTPSDPSVGVLEGLEQVARVAGHSLEALLAETDVIIHGTTVATNTLVERRGAKVGLITTEGFRDLLEMREGLKEDRYNLRMDPVEPLVPRYLRLTVPERIRSDGSVHRPLDTDAVDRALEALAAEGVDAIAVCLLFSYLHAEHEQRIAARIAERFPGTYTSLSHVVLPQIKEFDRLSTTVVNAYVGPSYGKYLAHLQDRLASLGDGGAPAGLGRRVLVMQSNGGVVPLADSAGAAVRAILSGPAGGVAGAALCGRAIGADRIIGFDMGGTSTDICLVEGGRPHVTSEKFEGGWKIAVPMVDVQTIGAGGGSIAWVDPGGILRVGPESAGADPGPACYGTGGTRPTVTDANLVLGYLDASNFLGGRTRLHAAVAEQAITDHVGGRLGLPAVEAAAGIHRVVSANIAEGIRLASVKRGIDPRGFAIVAFGGAAGLHAVRVARQLGVERVYLPAAAPVLSALGMLSTDLQYDFSRSFPASLSSIDLGAVRGILQNMEAEGRRRLATQGFEGDAVAVRFTSDMRYLDQIYEVPVEVPPPGLDDAALVDEWASAFHQRYEDLYAYRQAHQEIRLVTLRATVSGLRGGFELPPVEHRAASGVPASREVYLDGPRQVPVYAFDSLAVGQTIEGPAIVESPFTTVLLEAGDTAVGDTTGGLDISVASGDTARTAGASAADTDPVTLAVVGNRLQSIALEMMEVMLRTAMSQILNSSRDFSTAILDADCQMVAQGEGIPVHMSALPVAGAAARDYFGDELADGDLIALNDPYAGGSHLPDITVIKPIFFEGRLRFYAVNRAHHSDVGGATHGGYNPAASEIYHEGLRIPPLKLHERGVPRRDLLDMMAANVRHPENFLGDLNAQIGSVEVAARRITELMHAYGAERLERTIAAILDATERQVRSFIRSWPDGVYHGESLVDDDGFDSKLIPIRAKVTIAGDSLEIDLGESSRQVTGFINSAYANTRSLAHAAIMYVAPEDIARNEGSMRPVTVIAPKGLIVNANPPAPVCMSTNHCAEEIVEAIMQALANAVPRSVNAGFSRRLRYAITGVDPRTGRRFIWHFFFARGGGGASYGHDGWPNVGEVNVAGGIRAPSVEVTEERFPFLVLRHELRPGSAGEGQWRGGLGALCEMMYEGEGDARLNTAGDGVVVPPFGLFGGEPGRPHRYSIVSNGAERVLGSKETGVLVRPGDRIIALASGGGGYGDPASRDVAAREWDRRNGVV